MEGPTVPPRSKTQPYYAISPLWKDVVPIRQVDDGGTLGAKALATIAYTPRYAEAMSYLRAVMAEEEYSPRCLALTEDIITMNPAHYTVWIYRMRTLKRLWGVTPPPTSAAVPIENLGSDGSTTPQLGKTESEDVSQGAVVDDHTADAGDGLEKNVMSELRWLEGVSVQNLKNYQIWHHRNALVDLLPSPPPNEQVFLRRILSLDTKNYHVWSYRQWLCQRFPDDFLTTNHDTTSTDTTRDAVTGGQGASAKGSETLSEISEISRMIDEDVRNNSAWNHRYFIIFGHRELEEADRQKRALKDIDRTALLSSDSTRASSLDHSVLSDVRTTKTGGIDMAKIVQSEVEYTKSKIRLAPQNGSSWNYLRGVVKFADLPMTSFRGFCEEFIGADGDLWHTKEEVLQRRRRRQQHSHPEASDEHAEGGDEGVGSQQEASGNARGVCSSHAIEWLSIIYSFPDSSASAATSKDAGETPTTTAGGDANLQPEREKKHEGGDLVRAKECLRALAEKWDVVRRRYWEHRLRQMDDRTAARASMSVS